MNDVTTHREVERKFVVPAAFTTPDVASLPRIREIHADRPIQLEATYYDTDDLALFRWGITLRQRSGGHDAGWHLKLPVRSGRKGVRDELQLPDQPTLPAIFVDLVSPLLMGRALGPIVTVRTDRTPTRLHCADGAVELVDDQVTLDLDGSDRDSFREIEIEIVEDGPDATALMDELGALLQRAGAVPSSISKAARAFGGRTRNAPDVVIPPVPKPADLAVDALRMMISRDVVRFLHADVDVRRDAEDSVHQLRVAARRLRSTLRTFDPLFDAQWVAGMREDLAWIAREMGSIRDSEVLLDRLVQHIDTLPAHLQDPARAYVRDSLRSAREHARSGALAALRSDRHDYLVEDLVAAAREPRCSDAAYVSCDAALLELMRGEWKRLTKAIAKVDADSVTWHRARIKAKRARYAAESLAPIYGKNFERLAGRLAELTEELGTHQDAAVAQDRLGDMAHHAPPEIAYALGLLSAYEASLAEADRDAVRSLWPKVRSAAKRAGL